MGAKRLNEAKVREKRYYDKHAHPASFKPGDQVLALREPKRHKFEGHYIGPYTVLELTEKGDVIIVDSSGVRFIKHPNKLKIFHV